MSTQCGETSAPFDPMTSDVFQTIHHSLADVFTLHLDFWLYELDDFFLRPLRVHIVLDALTSHDSSQAIEDGGAELMSLICWLVMYAAISMALS